MFSSHEQIALWISTYGYGLIFLLNLVESFGIPVPGETALVASAIYAGTTFKLNIYLLVIATIAGTVAGDVIGFMLGRGVGFWFLVHHGRRVGLNERRIKLGQYLFLRYGTAMVVFVRFLPVLRGLIAFLAGANQMSWRRFLTAAVTSSIAWASLFGFGPYFLGKAASHLTRPLWLTLIAIAVVLVGFAVFYLHRNEARLEDEAEKALPGPVGPLRGPHALPPAA
ncbi:MAG TPA: DedA family protein [Rhizomicrobium sp.]|nr:DedA family protein [Rhizomicrobium sp.]